MMLTNNPAAWQCRLSFKAVHSLPSLFFTFSRGRNLQFSGENCIGLNGNKQIKHNILYTSIWDHVKLSTLQFPSLSDPGPGNSATPES